MRTGKKILSRGVAEVVVLEDAEAVATEAAARLAEAVAASIATRGEAHVALTGGSSGALICRRLAEPQWREVFDWTRVHLWWGDDRLVPADHPESNARLVFTLLLKAEAGMSASGTGAVGTDVDAGLVSGVTMPAGNVHPFPVADVLRHGAEPGLAAAQGAADRYARELRALVPADAAGVPAFDVLVLGVGPDGHILSVFPGSEALEQGASLAVAVPAPEHVGPHLARLTLNPLVVRTARLVLVMVAGTSKAEIVERVMRADRDPRRLPAQLALAENAVWLLDREAASRL